MQFRNKKDEYSLREVLECSNEVIISSWQRFGKLIKAYELIDWNTASEKARDLIKDGNAINYIETIRKETGTITQEPKQSQPQIQTEQEQKPKEVQQPIELNNPKVTYDLLTMVAPTLEKRIIQKGKYWAVARKRGYKDVSLELTSKDRTGYYLKLVFHKSRVEDQADIELSLHLDTVNGCLEALSYKDEKESIEVYQNRFKRDMIKPKEREEQNDFLFKRLNRMLQIDYVFVHEKNPQNAVKKAENTRLKKIEEQQQFRDRINDFIPDFQPSQVQLTEVHIQLGIKQKHINFINTHQQGLVLIPTKPKHEYENPLEFKPGFRLDKWGKVHFKGRAQRT